MIYLNEIQWKYWVESNIVNTSDLNKKVDRVIWIVHPFFPLWMNSSLNLRREKLFVEMSSFDRQINKTKLRFYLNENYNILWTYKS